MRPDSLLRLWRIYKSLTYLFTYLNDCSAFDHCDHWIFDAAIDLAKYSWGRGFPKFEGEVTPKRDMDKTPPI